MVFLYSLFRKAWWYKPEYIINELNINSVITVPGHDEILPINSLTAQRPYTMKGYAYSGEWTASILYTCFWPVGSEMCSSAFDLHNKNEINSGK